MITVQTAAAPFGTASTAALSIEALDRMTVNEKLAHFARKDAFKLPLRDGDKVARTRRLSRKGLPKKLTPGSIKMDGGHITGQAYQVIGRPCFGIPTAKLVHGREHKVQLDGNLVFARCGECPIKAACHFICDERLHANAAIWDSFRDFERCGGRDAFWLGDGRGRAVGSALRELFRHLQAANFTTVADADLAAHYDAKALEKRDADAKRQRQHRAQVQQTDADGDPVPSDEIITRDASLLREKLRVLQEGANCPRQLRKIDPVLLERVYAVRAKLPLLGKPHGTTAIAEALADRYPKLSLGALRKRIETVLKRLPALESSPTNSSNSAAGG